MQRKLIIVMALSYIVLIAIIVAVGLNFHQCKQPSISAYGGYLNTRTSKPDEEISQILQNTSVKTETKVWVETPSSDIKSLRSPSVEPTKTQTITAISEEPTQTKRTSTTSTPTLTQPAYPVSGEGTAIATITLPPYPVEDLSTSTLSPISTPTPSYTSTPQTGWIGDWTVFWQQGDGGYLSGLMVVSIDGSDVTTSVLIGDDPYNFTGILNESRVTVVGSWSGSIESGNFYWRTFEAGHFAGNVDRQFGFCGSRSGGVMPEPCLDVPSDK